VRDLFRQGARERGFALFGRACLERVEVLARWLGCGHGVFR
jgi:hypothetical protein